MGKNAGPSTALRSGRDDKGMAVTHLKNAIGMERFFVRDASNDRVISAGRGILVRCRGRGGCVDTGPLAR